MRLIFGALYLLQKIQIASLMRLNCHFNSSVEPTKITEYDIGVHLKIYIN